MPRRSTPAYTPRWLYHFFAAIERLPVPSWALALFIVLAIGLAAHREAWRLGFVPFGQFDLFVFAFGFFFVTGFVQWHYLTLRARPAIEGFFKGGDKSRAQIEAILTDFVSLPPTWGTLVFLLGSLVGNFGFSFSARLLPIIAEVLPSVGRITAIVSGGLIFILVYRIVRQSRLTRRFYSEVEVNLFNPAPLFALSSYAVASILALLLGTYLLQAAAFPSFLLASSGVIYSIVLNSILLLFFLGQLLEVNQRMRLAKQRLLAQIGLDLEKVNRDVHRAIGKRAYSAVGRMQASIVTLKNEHEMFQKIPTWPWQPETLRNLLTPMLLPVIVYLVQRFFGSLLGF